MGILRWLFGQQKTSVQAPRDKIVDSTPQNAVEVGFTVHDGDISTGLPLSPAEISPPKAEPCRSEIESLADEAWQLYDTSRSEECVVQPALPVLFFGDGAAYRRSQLRVITVGRNPSDEEFPSDNPYARFRGAEVSDGRARSSQFYNEYLLSLHQYFQHNPYSRWFANFEQMLGGFGCSYYSGWDTLPFIQTFVRRSPLIRLGANSLTNSKRNWNAAGSGCGTDSWTTSSRTSF